jgi:hypothetical protein
MSGRKQHYLPQFLQRPFSHRVVKNNYYVHVHEQRLIYSPSTTGVGAKRDFYSTTQDTRADDNITAAESVLSKVIDQIIRTKQLPHSADVSMLFSSLSIRTLKMRNAISELAPTMFAVLRKKATEEAWALEAIEKNINDQAWIDAQIEEELRKIGPVDRNKRATMKAWLGPRLKKELEANKPRLLAEFNELAQNAFDHLESQAATIANDAFSRIFNDTSGLEKRNLLFGEFVYMLVEKTSESFVLGDCAVAALDSQGRPRIAMANIDEQVLLKQIFLPISPDLLIYGTRDSSAPLPESVEINKLSAMLSNHFFISREESTPHIEQLKELICTATTPIVSAEELANF